MLFKRCWGTLCFQKTDGPRWVKWIHRSEGESHCQACLKLDGCLFLESKAPPCPHHPNCHCTLEEIPYAVVQVSVSAYSSYRKFDPYLFNTSGTYTHTKEKLFASWGYTVEDASWLQAEMERQAKEKYLAGEYTLGKLDEYGQRIIVRIEIPRKDNGMTVSFVSGWMVEPDGKLNLRNP